MDQPWHKQIPAPLTVAASLTAVEGLLMVGYGVLELASVSTERLAMGLTTAAFFAVYGGGLLVCAWAVARGHSWARSPIVLAQLIQLGIAWNFRGENTLGVAIALAVVGVVVIVGLLHPDSLDHLAEHEPDPDA